MRGVHHSWTACFTCGGTAIETGKRMEKVTVHVDLLKILEAKTEDQGSLESSGAIQGVSGSFEPLWNR